MYVSPVPIRFLAPIYCSKITELKSSVRSYGIDATKNLFHNGIDFSQGISSVELMPRVSKCLKILALATIQHNRFLERINSVAD
jgi:hypothetical protein